MSSRVYDDYRELRGVPPQDILRWELDGSGFEHLRLVEAPMPRPAADEVAFRVDVNVLCFSDVKIIEQAGNHPRLKKYDLARDRVVPGHEMSITLAAIGETAAKRGFRRGQRFTIQPDLNRHQSAVGYDVWGGLTQYGIFGPKAQDYFLPVSNAGVGYSAVALSEPWACIESSYRRADLQAGDKVFWLVGGAGPMGQMHLVRAIGKKSSGACPRLRTIIVTDISDDRLRDLQRRHESRAKAAEIELRAINTAAEDLGKQLQSLAPQGIDYAVALCPAPDAVVQALRFVRPYGVMSIFAGLKRGTGAISLGDIHYDSVTITGNSGSMMEDMERCLRLAEKDELDTDAAVGAVSGMRAAKEALQAVRESRISNKIAIYPQLPSLPLTRVEELPERMEFSPTLAGSLRSGRWNRDAEAAMLAQCLSAAP